VNSKRAIKAVAFAFVFLFVLGFVYPTVMSEITEHAIPFQSQGSPVKINGTVYGSYLIADAFNASYFFHPRPSANNTYAIDTNATLNQTLTYINQFRSENPGINLSQVPYAMVAYSASGVDPNIPILGAYDQVARIANSVQNVSAARNISLSVSSLESMLNSKISQLEQRNFPVFGSYYVNTVALNVYIINFMQNEGILPSGLLS
jgi:K+-transporting ATPase ATPase C chain